MKASRQIGKVTYARAIVLWGIVSLVPMIPFTLPLFQLSLSDSPRAYLIWIPFLAIAWSAWNLTTKPLPTEGANRLEGAGIGVFLSLVVLAGLIFGKSALPDWFFRYDIGLLGWPVWSLAMFWLVFGRKASRRAVLPLFYMLLGWPPIYEGIIALVNPVLAAIALKVMGDFGRMVSWMTIPKTEDVFDVLTGQGIVHISVTSACSGSDTILAILVIFPLMLVLFQLTLLKKVLLVVAGCVLAFVFNLLRIITIISALHAFGYHFAMDILHPVLGTVLFIIIIGLLLAYGGRHVTTVSPSFRVHLERGLGPSALSLVFAVVLTAGLVPMYFWRSGSELRPVTLNTTQLVELTRGLGQGAATVEHAGAQAGTVKATFISLKTGHATEEGVELSLSDSLAQAPFYQTAPEELMSPTGKKVKVQHAKLLARSLSHGIEEKTYLIDYADSHAPERSFQYLDTVCTFIGVYNFERVYLTSQWTTAVSGATGGTGASRATGATGVSAAADASIRSQTLLQSQSAARAFVRRFIANAKTQGLASS